MIYDTILVARRDRVLTISPDRPDAAAMIASMSLPIAMMTRESVNRAHETILAEGIRFERRGFHAMFAMEGRKEDMKAFIEKRPAGFRHR